jgi:DNA-binding SARP family transcriptional activator/Tfp pilus assembly protein PilF
VPEETEFCLLGPLTVRRGAATVTLTAGKQRVVLAALLLSANRLVSLDELSETLWEGHDGPPRSARVTVQNYVKRLRQALRDTGGDRIATGTDGYVMTVQASELDVTRFEQLISDGRQAARDGSWESAASHLRTALGLWRGQPLADVPSPGLALREVPRLTELRWQALETRIDADLHLGRHGDVIVELQQLAVAEPLRERLHAFLMVALYRDGRQGDALAAYRRARAVLADELGADPGPELQELQERVLAGDRDLAVPGAPPRRAAGDSPATPAVPRQLPALPRNFVGRQAELTALTDLLEQAAEGGNTLVITAIGGTAGVGKTALAVRWAHQLTERFPDGQLYVDLRGYDPDQPLPATDALAAFLRALGVPGPDIPAETDDRAARYRSLLAGRQILVVVDNASDAEQVRPLLPGTLGCAALVTSRDSLAGLVAREGALRLNLDLLPLTDAVGLLRDLIGGRATADPGAAAALAEQCVRLPLALRVAAELAVTRPGASLAELTRELADQQRRLDLLDAGGDPRTGVRAVFSWSYRHLDEAAARMFRLVGLHPGPDLDPYAAAALAGTAVQQARRLLGRLARAHLLQETSPGRYGQHDLLRAYARDLAGAQETETGLRAALTSLFDYYLHGAGTAMDALYAAEQHRRPPVHAVTSPVPPLASTAAARSWLEAESAVLVTSARYTADHGWPAHTTALAATLFRYLDVSGRYPEAMTIHTSALRAARGAGDARAEGGALTSLGVLAWRMDRYQHAAGQLRKAATIYQQAGDLSGEARAMHNLGIVSLQQADFAEAGRHLHRSLAAYREVSDRTEIARVLTSLSAADLSLGRWQEADRHLAEALSLARDTGDQIEVAHVLGVLGLATLRQGRYEEAVGHLEPLLALLYEVGDLAGQAQTLANLAEIDARQGRYETAAERLRQSTALWRQIGYRSAEAYTLADLGGVYLQQGDYQRAAEELRDALALCRDIGSRPAETRTLNNLGDLLVATGKPAAARARYAAALSLASQPDDPEQQARAHDGLGQVDYAAGDHLQARRRWREALRLYTKLGVIEADLVRAKIAATDDAATPVDSPATSAPLVGLADAEGGFGTRRVGDDAGEQPIKTERTRCGRRPAYRAVPRSPAKMTVRSRPTAASDGRLLAAVSACRQYCASSPTAMSSRMSPASTAAASRSVMKPCNCCCARAMRSPWCRSAASSVP